MGIWSTLCSVSFVSDAGMEARACCSWASTARPEPSVARFFSAGSHTALSGHSWHLSEVQHAQDEIEK